MTSTDNFAIEKSPSTIRAKTSESLKLTQRHNALNKAIKKKLTHSAFKIDP
jgi:hypothetical protein